MRFKVTGRNYIYLSSSAQSAPYIRAKYVILQWALYGHCTGTVWALYGHCMGTVWALAARHKHPGAPFSGTDAVHLCFGGQKPGESLSADQRLGHPYLCQRTPRAPFASTSQRPNTFASVVGWVARVVVLTRLLVLRCVLTRALSKHIERWRALPPRPGDKSV